MFFFLGFLAGFPLGFVAAIAFDMWLDMLYDPPLPNVSDEADEYVRAQPRWRRNGP